MAESRIFFMTHRRYSGFIGGASGVNYRLYHFNRDYKTFEGLVDRYYFVFSNTVIEGTESSAVPIKSSSSGTGKEDPSPLSAALAPIKKIPPFSWIDQRYASFQFLRNYKKRLKRIKRYYQKLEASYGFNDRDLFVIQDIQTAFALKEIISPDNLVVYHSQGSLFQEKESQLGLKLGKGVKRFFDRVQKDVFEYYDVLGFPSRGACDTVREQLPDVHFEGKRIEILYNTFNRADISEEDRKAFLERFAYADVLKSPVLKFVSVSTLTHLKGIDQTIELLGALKNAGIDFVWFMIGNGQSSYIEQTLEPLLQANNLEDNTKQIRSLPNKEVNMLLGESDYYIMMHRASIFDIATLEAMSNHCIPILSKVGGNLEFNVDGNCFLYEDNLEELIHFVGRSDTEALKTRNHEIAMTVFGNKPFLERYEALIKKQLANH